MWGDPSLHPFGQRTLPERALGGHPDSQARLASPLLSSHANLIITRQHVNGDLFTTCSNDFFIFC